MFTKTALCEFRIVSDFPEFMNKRFALEMRLSHAVGAEISAPIPVAEGRIRRSGLWGEQRVIPSKSLIRHVFRDEFLAG